MKISKLLLGLWIATAVIGTAVVLPLGASVYEAETETLTLPQLYLEAEALGYHGDYEEFVAVIENEVPHIREIVSVRLNEAGELIVVLSDGEEIDLGKITGKDGKDGKDGEDGQDGKDGVGIAEVYVDEYGHLIVVLTNGETVDCGFVAGLDGVDGVDGQTPRVGENGNWWIGEVDTGISARGPQGEQGDVGPQGEQGEKGDTGEQGPQGVQGEKGEKGDTGAQGPQGEKGDTGAQGPQGEKGEKGDTGAQGPQGEKGEKGDTGAQGPQGEKGDTGAQGPQGEKGDPGVDGKDGVDGEDGKDGATPHIGDNGNWWIGDFDTNVSATPHTHTLSEWKPYIEATCSNVGYNMRECACGYREFDLIPQTAHSYGEWRVLIEPTCLACGLQIRTCTVCHAAETEDIAQVNHSYENGKCKYCEKEPPVKFAFAYEDGGYVVTGSGGFEEDTLVVPAEIDGIPVLRVKESAFFQNTSITHVELHAKYIGDNAFEQCGGLRSVVLGTGVEVVGEFVFAGCEDIESVTISETVKEIGAYAFENCESTNYEFAEGKWVYDRNGDEVELDTESGAIDSEARQYAWKRIA